MTDDIRALTARLADEPASLAFLELAEALRRRGQLDAAAQGGAGRPEPLSRPGRRPRSAGAHPERPGRPGRRVRRLGRRAPARPDAHRRAQGHRFPLFPRRRRGRRDRAPPARRRGRSRRSHRSPRRWRECAASRGADAPVERPRTGARAGDPAGPGGSRRRPGTPDRRSPFAGRRGRRDGARCWSTATASGWRAVCRRRAARTPAIASPRSSPASRARRPGPPGSSGSAPGSRSRSSRPTGTSSWSARPPRPCCSPRGSRRCRWPASACSPSARRAPRGPGWSGCG